jgi:hypothetical protein
MTEDPELPGPAEDPAEDIAEDIAADETEPERVRTGVAGVDEVIVAVEELEERPVAEHVGVFEAAQDRLRRALDSGADPA